MPNWKKVLTSGSAGELASLYAPSITGSLQGTASYALSSSFAITASYFSGSISNAIFAETASFITASNVYGPYGSNSIVTASFAQTASIALSSLNASDILIYVKNVTGASIAKGKVVRISGATGDNALISTASWDSDGVSANTLGIANETIADQAFGYVMTEGKLLGINTDSFTAGQLLFLGPTGSIISAEPVPPKHAVRLGQALRIQQNNGSMYVRIDNGYELDELHNVLIISGSDGDLLVASGSNDNGKKLYINSRQLTGSYGITGSLTFNNGTGGVTGSLFGTASFATSASNALTASYVSNAVSASYATTASFVTTAQTASYVLNAVSASYATSALSASYAPAVVPQANKIYIDSLNGTNSTGRGNINTPYLTVEYALADITNTGTVTATTTNASATLTSVSSTANIVIGQYITGAGIPYNTVVVSKTVNTIVLSQVCTASATITATWWTIYELMLNGNFVWVSNWHKQGFFINAQTSTISFSGVLLSPASPVVPIVFKGGFLYGTSASSKFLSITGASGVKVFLNPTTYFSRGTSYQIDCNQNGSSKFDSLYLLCDSFLANFGQVADIESSGTSTIKGTYYGLLGGIRLRYATIFFDGDMTCPTSVTAFSSVTSGNLFTNGRITGNLSIQSSGGVINSTISGTAHLVGPQIFNGTISGTVSVFGMSIFNGVVYGNITVTGGTSYFNAGVSTLNSTTTISITVSNAKVVVFGSISATGTNGIGNITLTSSSTLDILDNVIGVSYTTYSSIPSISVDATSTLNLYKTNFGNITSCAGTINIYGTFSHINKSADITGTLNNKNGTIQLLRLGTESSTITPTISISSGTYQQTGGKLSCALSDSKSGLLRKTATGGKIQLINQAYLKVANGLAPIQILSNTGTAQNVEVYSVIDNCAVGFRVSDTFTDTTYGTAYAPNILIGGTMLEDTTYLL